MLALLNLVLISFKVYSVPKMYCIYKIYKLLYLDLYESFQVGNQGGVKVYVMVVAKVVV